MPHLHIGLMHALAIYLMWLLIHIPVQLVAVKLHGSRIGQALAFAG